MTSPVELSEQLEQAIGDAASFAQSCSADEWATIVPGEDWPVGVVIHHIAVGHDLVSRWIEQAREGRPIDVTAEAIDEGNARHAKEAAGVGVEETVELLRANGAAVVELLRSLDEKDLDNATPFAPAGGQPFSVEQLGAAAAAHVRSHLGHAQAAVGRQAAS
jgi:hypothetical protein